MALTRTRRRRLLAGIAAFLVTALILGLAAGAAGAAGNEGAAAGALLGPVAKTVAEATGHEVPAGGASSPSSQASPTPAYAQGATPASGGPPRSQGIASSGTGPGSGDASRSTGSPPSSSRPKIPVVESVSATLAQATAPAAAGTRRAVTTVTHVVGAAVQSTPAIHDVARQVEAMSGIGPATLASARKTVSGVVAGATGGGQLDPVLGTRPETGREASRTPRQPAGLPPAGSAAELRAGQVPAPGAVEQSPSGLMAATVLQAGLATARAPEQTSLQMTGTGGAASPVGASGDSAAPASAGPGAYPPASADGAGSATPVPPSSALTAPPRVPGGGGVPASSGGAVAACAGLALALLWLLGVAFSGVTRRLRGRSEICLSAPFELILERPG